MASDWPRSWLLKPLEECMATIIDYRGKTPRKARLGIPLITAKVVKGGRILTPDEFVPPEDYEAWARRGIPASGDVVLTTEAPLGEVAQLGDQTVALAQRIIALRGIPGLLNNRYLKFLIQSEFVQDQLRARATGTTVLGIKQAELRKVMLPLPPLPEQEAIGSLLGVLDDKIELNRQMNRTLEAMAQGFFRSWFVDFDPVAAKAAGLQPLGMDHDTATLFPDRFADSAVGPAPFGWRAGCLADIAEINARQIAEIPAPVSIRYIDISAVSVGRINAVPQYPWPSAPSRARRLVRHGDTVWSCVRPNRRSYCLIRHPEPDLVASTGLAVLSPRNSSATAFVYLWTTTDDFVDYLTSHAEGSAYPAVRPDSFAQSTVLIPPSPILRAFEVLVDPLLELIWRNEEEASGLAALRDTLLPRVFSGELRVREAEKVAERAGA